MAKVLWFLIIVLLSACGENTSPDINTLRYTGFNVKVVGDVNLTLPYKVTDDIPPASAQWLTNVDINGRTFPQVLRFHHPQADYTIEIFTDSQPSNGAFVLSLAEMNEANPYVARLVSNGGKVYDRNVGGSITIERVSETVMLVENQEFIIDEISGRFNFIAEAEDSTAVQVTGDFMGIPRPR